MSQNERQNREDQPALAGLNRRADRREFLRLTGAGALTVVAVACDEPTRTVSELEIQTVTRVDTVAPPPPTFPSVTLDFANDFGVVNYAYALEQLEAAFYTQVVATPYSGITDRERQVMVDLRDHEVVHREFLRAALGNNAIGALTPNFSAVNFSSRDSVLSTARAFEDLGVAAYNGAAQFLRDAGLLTIAGKIVSVEARHASAIRDLLSPRSRDFAPRPFDDALPPQQVLSIAAPFIRNTVTLANIPNFIPSANRA